MSTIIVEVVLVVALVVVVVLVVAATCFRRLAAEPGPRPRARPADVLQPHNSSNQVRRVLVFEQAGSCFLSIPSRVVFVQERWKYSALSPFAARTPLARHLRAAARVSCSNLPREGVLTTLQVLLILLSPPSYHRHLPSIHHKHGPSSSMFSDAMLQGLLANTARGPRTR